ncbi:MAG: RNA-binding protein [Candidatus Schekmanbacteria bacterium]|nr:RNA-binding protein [Candidatus Schekmanbacteria bacterium]
MKIYVGNLPYSATKQELRTLFEEYGDVETVDLVIDKETGKPRGFGFVIMEDKSGDAAVKALDGYQMAGRRLKVDSAREKPPTRRPPRPR